MIAADRVREFLTVHTASGNDDLIATRFHHDGMGTAVALLRASDLRAVLDELQATREVRDHLNRTCARLGGQEAAP